MTPKKFKPAAERQKLIRMFQRLRSIVEKQLETLEADPEKLTASLLDTCLRAIRQMPDILVDLEKLEQQAHLKETAKEELRQVLNELPSATRPAPPPVDPMSPDPAFPDPYQEPEAKAIELPFPLKGDV